MKAIKLCCRWGQHHHEEQIEFDEEEWSALMELPDNEREQVIYDEYLIHAINNCGFDAWWEESDE